MLSIRFFCVHMIRGPPRGSHMFHVERFAATAPPKPELVDVLRRVSDHGHALSKRQLGDDVARGQAVRAAAAGPGGGTTKRRHAADFTTTVRATMGESKRRTCCASLPPRRCGPQTPASATSASCRPCSRPLS